MRFVLSNGQKTTLEWPKVVSEVNFPTFWGVFRSTKVVSVFNFGDRKCRFRDIVIRPFSHKRIDKGLSIRVPYLSSHKMIFALKNFATKFGHQITLQINCAKHFAFSSGHCVIHVLSDKQIVMRLFFYLYCTTETEAFPRGRLSCR